jgi:hypothetical protein
VTEDPPRRVRGIREAVEEITDTFAAAGTDVHNSESRERFAAEHRWLRDQRTILESRPRRSAFDNGLRWVAAGIPSALLLIAAGWSTLHWASDVAGMVRDLRNDARTEARDRCHVDRYLREYLREIEGEHHALFAALNIPHPETGADLDDSTLAECVTSPPRRNGDVGG